MALAKSKDRDAQTPQESEGAATETYPPRSDEQTRLHKVQHLDVDRVLARSFKNVKSSNLALTLNEQSLEQGKVA